MHVRRSLVATALAPLLLGFGLSGCQEAEPEPKMPKASASTPSPTETATAEEETPEEFIRRWVALDREMQNSGEIGEYMQVSAECVPCVDVAKRVEDMFAAGGYVRTDGWEILRIRDRSGPTGGRIVDVRVRSTPTTYKESTGSNEETLKGGVLTYRLRLNAQAPWRVTNLNQLAS